MQGGEDLSHGKGEIWALVNLEPEEARPNNWKKNCGFLDPNWVKKKPHAALEIIIIGGRYKHGIIILWNHTNCKFPETCKSATTIKVENCAMEGKRKKKHRDMKRQKQPWLLPISTITTVDKNPQTISKPKFLIGKQTAILFTAKTSSNTHTHTRYPPSPSHHPHHQHHLECKKTSNMFLVRKQQLGIFPEASILNFPLLSSQTKRTISKRHTRNKMGCGKKIATQISTSTHTHTHTKRKHKRFLPSFVFVWVRAKKPNPTKKKNP